MCALELRSRAARPRSRRSLPGSKPKTTSVSREVLTRGRALRGSVHRVERLAGGHEQPVPLGTAEADVAADLRQPDPTDQLAVRIPHRDAAVADAPSGIARTPEVALDVAAHAVRSALHAVDHEAREELAVGGLVVAADVEHPHVALATRPGVARSLARADDVELLVVGREDQTVRIRHQVLADDQNHLPARVDAVGTGGQLALAVADLQRLPQPRLEPALGVAGTSRCIRRALVEL